MLPNMEYVFRETFSSGELNARQFIRGKKLEAKVKRKKNTRVIIEFSEEKIQKLV